MKHLNSYFILLVISITQLACAQQNKDTGNLDSELILPKNHYNEWNSIGDFYHNNDTIQAIGLKEIRDENGKIMYQFNKLGYVTQLPNSYKSYKLNHYQNDSLLSESIVLKSSGDTVKKTTFNYQAASILFPELSITGDDYTIVNSQMKSDEVKLLKTVSDYHRGNIVKTQSQLYDQNNHIVVEHICNYLENTQIHTYNYCQWYTSPDTVKTSLTIKTSNRDTTNILYKAYSKSGNLITSYKNNYRNNQLSAYTRGTGNDAFYSEVVSDIEKNRKRTSTINYNDKTKTEKHWENGVLVFEKYQIPFTSYPEIMIDSVINYSSNGALYFIEVTSENFRNARKTGHYPGYDIKDGLSSYYKKYDEDFKLAYLEQKEWYPEYYLNDFNKRKLRLKLNSDLNRSYINQEVTKKKESQNRYIRITPNRQGGIDSTLIEMLELNSKGDTISKYYIENEKHQNVYVDLIYHRYLIDYNYKKDLKTIKHYRWSPEYYKSGINPTPVDSMDLKELIVQQLSTGKPISYNSYKYLENADYEMQYDQEQLAYQKVTKHLRNAEDVITEQFYSYPSPTKKEIKTIHLSSPEKNTIEVFINSPSDRMISYQKRVWDAVNESMGKIIEEKITKYNSSRIITYVKKCDGARCSTENYELDDENRLELYTRELNEELVERITIKHEKDKVVVSSFSPRKNFESKTIYILGPYNILLEENYYENDALIRQTKSTFIYHD